MSSDFPTAKLAAIMLCGLLSVAVEFYPGPIAAAEVAQASLPADRLDPCAEVAPQRADVRLYDGSGVTAVLGDILSDCASTVRDVTRRCALFLEAGETYQRAVAKLGQEHYGASDRVHFRVWAVGAFRSYLSADTICSSHLKRRAKEGFRWALSILSS